VAYAGSLFSADVADIAVGLLIDALRKISAGNHYVTQGLWANNGDFSLGSKVKILLGTWKKKIVDSQRDKSIRC